MKNELRCGGTMHGILSDDHCHIEVKCKRRSCGVKRGVVVIHTFDIQSGELLSTKQYSDPASQKG